jgi:two-component system, NarL family, sensor histidine kinase UhpB
MNESTPALIKSGAARHPVLPKRSLIAYAIVILAALWSYEYWQIQNDRRATLENARNQLLTIAGSLGTHIEAMIHDGVGAALAGASEIAARGGVGTVPEREAQAVLSRMLTGGDYVRQVFVAKPNVFVSASRPGFTVDPPSAWIGTLLDAKTHTWLGPPIRRGENDAHVVLPIAQKTARPTEWAGALFGVESLDRMYRNLPIAEGTVSLVSSSGIVLMRAPVDARLHAVGLNISDSAAFKLSVSEASALIVGEAPNPVTEAPRLYALSRISTYPLLAVAGRDVVDVLAPWRLRARSAIERTAATTIAIMLLTVILYTVLLRRYAALRRSEERFQLAAAGTNDGIWDWDVATNDVYYSPRLKECLGFEAADEFAPSPDTFWSLMHPDDLEVIRDAVQRHLEDRVPYEAEYRVRTRTGEYRWFRARAQAVWNDQGAPMRMAGSISDIHERKLAERSLQDARMRELHAREEFAQHLLLAQEQERQRLANELHDSVGQNLSLIKNRALLALQASPLPDEIREHVTALSALTSDVITEVRTVAQNLRPLHIEQLGLTDALQTLLDKVAESSTLTIERRLENVDDALTGTAATHLFRVVQEALNNILKHAQATHCRVWLERDLHWVRLTVADNGVGFDVLADSHGLGLASIAERTRMLSAKLRIESAARDRAKRGTTVHIDIPVAEPAFEDTGGFAGMSVPI